MTQPYPLTSTLPTPSTRKRLPLRLRSNALIGGSIQLPDIPTPEWCGDVASKVEGGIRVRASGDDTIFAAKDFFRFWRFFQKTNGIDERYNAQPPEFRQTLLLFQSD